MSLFTAVLIQFAAMISFQFVCLLPFEWVYFPRPRSGGLKPEQLEMLLFLFCVLLGVCMGSLTLLLLGERMIQNPFLNFLNLFITPFVVGRMICWLHQRRTYLKERIYLFDSIWNAYIFSFCISTIRYILI